MKQSRSSLYYLMLSALVLISAYNSCKANPKYPKAEIHLVGSTPGDDEIKSLLAISPETKVDFIRWNLLLKEDEAGRQRFTLNIVYGESKPNTLGFINGGERKSIEGQYSVTHIRENNMGFVYHLKSNTLPNEILMVKISDNIFHLRSPKGNLLIGNGGWSYTLNRKQPIYNGTPELPIFKSYPDQPVDTSSQVTFEGRTPCMAFAREYNLTVDPGCIKLKWKLILYRDRESHKPTIYRLRRTNSRENDITGKWTIIKGLPSNPNVIIYQIDPDKPEQSISLVLADENLAFFLHKNNRLFTGNEDFSYTLNKRRSQ